MTRAFGSPAWGGRGLAWLICLWGTVGPASAAERLTEDGTLKLSPAFTQEGEVVTYATHEIPNLVSIWKLSLKDGTRERLHPNVSTHQFDPAWSADDHFHAYVTSSTSPQLVLVMQDLQAGTEATFRPLEARATARHPTIAPDGSRVVFSLSDVRGHQIASVDIQGNDLKLLTETAGMNAWPSYSPNGSQIAFGSSRDDDFEIYVMDADGSNPRRLTHSRGRDQRPAWSPDGRRIAFTSARDGNDDVYVMDVEGNHLLNVTQNADRDDYPIWHPDGKRLLTISTRDGQSDLYLYHVAE